MTAGTSLGNRQRQATMLGAHDAGNIGFNQRGELAGIKMSPFTMSVVVYRTIFPTFRADQRSIIDEADEDSNRPGLFIKGESFDLPW